MGFSFSEVFQYIRLPSVRKFYYNNGGAIVGDSDFLLQNIGVAIAQLKPCLEELCVTNDGGDNCGDEPMSGIVSLTAFEKLHTVVMEAETVKSIVYY
jgi:hypothetical protein